MVWNAGAILGAVAERAAKRKKGVAPRRLTNVRLLAKYVHITDRAIKAKTGKGVLNLSRLFYIIRYILIL